MDWEKDLYNMDEKPLDKLVDGYSYTSVFRKIAFIGDSLSSGEFETRDKDGNPGYYDMFEYSWGQYIARRNGLLAYNFSRGGMTTKEYVESFAQEKGFWDKEKACQAYVIALGVNDIFHSALKFEIGTFSDVDKEDYTKNKETLVGYYAKIVSKYKEISPDAKFFFVTLPKSGDDVRDKGAIEFRRALYELAQYFDNCYVIDLYEYAPVYDEKFKERFYLYGHLSPAGYILTAQMVDSYIDYIVRHNYEEFKNIGFVGTDIEY